MKVSGIYRCYHYNLTNYLRDLQLFLDESTNIKNHLIVGDMNIDLLTFDKITEDYWYIMQRNNYVSLINSVTHLSGNINGGSCIDHAFLKSHYNVKSGKLLDQITDHMSLFI